uniref:Uncharacterized protein n=1 Tax=Trichogramma kaykai TaxID=54128 RepID=A0ABD2WST6_9HYME
MISSTTTTTKTSLFRFRRRRRHELGEIEEFARAAQRQRRRATRISRQSISSPSLPLEGRTSESQGHFLARSNGVSSLGCRDISNKCRDRVAEQIIKFAVKTGYRDELNAEKDGRGEPSSSSLRTTPIHHAARRKLSWIISDLFEIYDRYNVNHTDETGLSHFHVACCQYDCDDFVEKFLELGQVDPDLLVPETGDSALHLAVSKGRKKLAELLLKNGANPNLINKDGLTPLLIICQKQIYWHDNQYAELAEMFLKISKEKNQVVQVDAKDKLGLTSLHWAVVNTSPKTIDVLVDHGADLSSFVFPTASHFLDALKWRTDFEDAELDEDAEFEKSMSSAVEIMAGLLTVVERLEKRGYELSRDDASTIVLVLSKNEFSWDSEELWYDNEDFADKAKKIMINEDDPSLPLYDLVQLRPKEAAKRVTFRDYNALTDEFESLPEWSRRDCASPSVRDDVARILPEMGARFTVETDGLSTADSLLRNDRRAVD